MKPPSPIQAQRLLVIGLSLALGIAVARASSEYEIKAAYLYNFAKFVDWPAESFKSDSAPFIIGLVGEGPIATTLPSLVHDEKVRQRPIEIRHLRPGEDPAGCHLLFVSRSESPRLDQLLPAAAKANILTVGEDAEFLAEGGMINFVLVSKNVRFDINQKALARTGLKVSSKLLAVARTVLDQP